MSTNLFLVYLNGEVNVVKHSDHLFSTQDRKVLTEEITSTVRIWGQYIIG